MSAQERGTPVDAASRFRAMFATDPAGPYSNACGAQLDRDGELVRCRLVPHDETHPHGTELSDGTLLQWIDDSPADEQRS